MEEIKEVLIVAKRFKFPAQLISGIYKVNHDFRSYRDTLEKGLDEIFKDKSKRIPIQELPLPRAMEEIVQRVLTTERIHLESEFLTFENILQYVKDNSLEIVDEITTAALLDVCKLSPHPIDGFACIGMPFCFNNDDYCYLYPNKDRGTGGPYSYRQYQCVKKTEIIPPKFIELFVRQIPRS